MRPTLLAFQIPPEKLTRLRVLCMKLKIKLQPVAPSQYAAPLGSLVGLLPAQEDSGCTELGEEMLVMAGFDQDLLNRFLRTYRSDGIAPVQLKAILTPSNCAWSAYALQEELRRERAAIEQRT